MRTLPAVPSRASSSGTPVVDRRTTGRVRRPAWPTHVHASAAYGDSYPSKPSTSRSSRDLDAEAPRLRDGGHPGRRRLTAIASAELAETSTVDGQHRCALRSASGRASRRRSIVAHRRSSSRRSLRRHRCDRDRLRLGRATARVRRTAPSGVRWPSPSPRSLRSSRGRAAGLRLPPPAASTPRRSSTPGACAGAPVPEHSSRRPHALARSEISSRRRSSSWLDHALMNARRSTVLSSYNRYPAGVRAVGVTSPISS